MLKRLPGGRARRSPIRFPILIGILLLLTLLVTACGGSDSPEQSATAAGTTEPTTASAAKGASIEMAMEDRKVGGSVGNIAPEFGGIDAWINSNPLTMEELRGKVVLIDFWTYTCINCIRTFPYLKQWHSRYADDGLVIVGVHTSEFEFEKDYDNVVEATVNDSLVWPMAQDNDYVTWRRYSNRYWPAKYLIDKDGVVRYMHFGEDAYAETEEIIRELLEEANPEFRVNNLELPKDQTLDPAFLSTRNARVTRELYGGYERGQSDLLYGRVGYVRPVEYFENKDKVFDFTVEGDLEPDKIYFEGPWHIGPESSTHGRMTENFEDSLSIVYSATSVNAVLTSETGEPYKVRLKVDGEYLTEENKGIDVMIADNGESYVWVTTPTLYNIVKNPSYVTRERLEMSPNSNDFGLFAFTFGVYDNGH